MKPGYTFTRVPPYGYQCNDCGAVASTVEMVIHYPSCDPGSCQREVDANNARDFEQEEKDDADYEAYLNLKGKWKRGEQ